ncbi:MAG: hypothetical protein ABI078_10970 [Rhodanobacter sp.]
MRALDIGRSHADHSPMPALPSPAHTALPWRLLSWVASLALLGVAAWVLHRYLTQIAWHAWRTRGEGCPGCASARPCGAQ